MIAERLVLYTLSFDLHVDSPHGILLRTFGELHDPNASSAQQQQEAVAYKDVYQGAWNFVNDR